MSGEVESVESILEKYIPPGELESIKKILYGNPAL